MTEHTERVAPAATESPAADPETYGAIVSEADLLVYGIHGRGQSPEFIRGLADRVGELDRFRWVIPAAPGNSWYPQGFMAPVDQNQPFLDEALKTVDTQLSSLLQHDIPVIALGFSQGACLLAEFLLTTRRSVDGVILHTGGYLGPEQRSFGAKQDFLGTPVAVLTAREDPWVPLHRSKETAREFHAAGAEVTTEIYEDEEHHINDAAVNRIHTLFEEVAAR